MSPAVQRQASTGVPFLDLAPSHEPILEEVLAEIGELILTGAFTNGPQVQQFESAFAAFCGTNHCVGVASGLDALRLALQAAGIEPGDEVILPANTFVATAEAVSQAGGAPVLVDVTAGDYNIDPVATAAAVTSLTRFILPVHLYGQLADMPALVAVARRHDLEIVEDACQAHGASRDGARAGSTGDAAAFSFYPGKNLGAFGDAGALVTNSAAIRDRVRALREHGQGSKYHHDHIGWTSRLDTIQAIALLRKLPQLARWTDERRAVAGAYLERLSGTGDLVLPPVAPSSEPVWHLFVVTTADPAALGAFLRERGIHTGRHYPQPIHRSQAYAHLELPEGSFPVTEALARECLSLPIFPGMSDSQVELVCSAIETYFARG